MEYHPPYFQAQWWLHHVMGMLVLRTGEFFWIKRNRMEIITGKILEGNLVQSASNRLGEEITFQQDNKTQGHIYPGVPYQDDCECS
jgi:hypothetical protein